jgi:hypothetical protein
MLTENQKTRLKRLHLGGVALFSIFASYAFVFSLRNAGLGWWAVFSLSSYSMLVVVLLIALYMFALFRSMSQNQMLHTEHPLTSSVYYYFFYSISPILGVIVGLFGWMGEEYMSHWLAVMANGCMWTTFLVWIVVDPLAGLLEMILPSSRKHRQARLSEAKGAKLKEQEERRELFAQIEQAEQREEIAWNTALLSDAEKLAKLLSDVDNNYEKGQAESVDIGLKAWQLGGLNCMKYLHLLTSKILNDRRGGMPAVDYLSVWWDGVGNWRYEQFAMCR